MPTPPTTTRRKKSPSASRPRRKTPSKTPSRNRPEAHYANRQHALVKALKKGAGTRSAAGKKKGNKDQQKPFDAMLVTNPLDIHYLTGYPGEDAYLLVTAANPNKPRCTIFSDFRYEEDLEPFKAWANVVMRTETLAKEVGKVTSDLKCKRVALQAEYLRITERKDIAKAIGTKKVSDTIGVISKLRLIKDDVEIRLIRKAIRIAEQSLEATLETLESGQSERAICARLEYEMKLRGAEGASFAPIIAAQANGSKPHYTPSARVKLRKNKPLLIDWGARVDGYISDLTRTFGFGSMPAKVREIYEIVLESQLAAIAAIKPGVELRAVDAAARDIIKEAGYGERFGHGLGHGIGLNVHEGPGLSYRAKKGDVLKPGMVVTVEPGIYLPGIGGVRIEDDVLVTERGRRVLSGFRKDLESAII